MLDTKLIIDGILKEVHALKHEVEKEGLKLEDLWRGGYFDLREKLSKQYIILQNLSNWSWDRRALMYKRSVSEIGQDVDCSPYERVTAEGRAFNKTWRSKASNLVLLFYDKSIREITIVLVIGRESDITNNYILWEFMKAFIGANHEDLYLVDVQEVHNV